MNLQHLMTPNPAVCVVSDTCAKAGELMRKRACGFLPVVDGLQSMRLRGVVTDRDIFLHLTRFNEPAAQVPVERCMTKDVQTIALDADLGAAAEAMEAKGVYRLPVIDGQRVVGVLSIKDLAKEARQQWALAGPHPAERQMTEIMEAVAWKQAREGAADA